MKAKQFIKKLEAIGVDVIPGRGKGGHCRLELNGRRSVLSVHGARDLGPEYMKTVCRQLGLNPKDVF